ncbi:hypothetical protein BDZ89DRAFT_1162288 [Hymenopellis radicata]|nr:hypothetical protein BDZ89DRAFT_1162288 [Hymenopellis radicata]
MPSCLRLPTSGKVCCGPYVLLVVVDHKRFLPNHHLQPRHWTLRRAHQNRLSVRGICFLVGHLVALSSSSQFAFGMPPTVSQCTNCGAFTRRSLHHEGEYQSSVLLERLRTTNFPATDEEISHIQLTILPTVSDDISSIDSKVASLHEVIRSMEEERERLINVQKKYNNLISLHRTLPSEIWSEIFMHTRSDFSDSNAFDASGSIWKLSHVCQRWRNIALSLRSFWSTMNLCFPEAAQHEGMCSAWRRLFGVPAKDYWTYL